MTRTGASRGAPQGVTDGEGTKTVASDAAFRLAELGPGFVRRILVTTLWVGAIAFVSVGVYLGIPKALAWGSGLILGLANLWLLDGFLREMLRPDGARVRSLVIFALLKFPAIYLLGAAALVRGRLDPLFVLCGFSLFLVVALLKVLGRLTLTVSPLARDRSGAGGPLLRKGTQGRVR